MTFPFPPLPLLLLPKPAPKAAPAPAPVLREEIPPIPRALVPLPLLLLALRAVRPALTVRRGGWWTPCVAVKVLWLLLFDAAWPSSCRLTVEAVEREGDGGAGCRVPRPVVAPWEEGLVVAVAKGRKREKGGKWRGGVKTLWKWGR